MKNHYQTTIFMIIKLRGSPKPLLSVQLDRGHKPSETRRLLRGHSEEKIPCLLLFKEVTTNWDNPEVHRNFSLFCIYLAVVCSSVA